MTTKATVVRNAGHPWDGRSGWDHLYVEASTEAEMDELVAKAKTRYWDCWLIGVNESSGCPGGLLYKPSGVRAVWTDNPHRVN